MKHTTQIIQLMEKAQETVFNDTSSLLTRLLALVLWTLSCFYMILLDLFERPEALFIVANVIFSVALTPWCILILVGIVLAANLKQIRAILNAL